MACQHVDVHVALKYQDQVRTNRCERRFTCNFFRTSCM